ncbi:Coenzyme F420 hydrogenase/dehydrogenase, beta subunit C-terminal domain [bacterium]|nr:Coenzyme F420 hydrogenase/dehydrogenase, beta subunit C-terminal domain [bacterium]
MKILELDNKCTGCMACFNICPVKAISMVENEEGFIFPSIDNSICIKCYKCENTCPEINIAKRTDRNSINKVFYGWNNDTYVRKKSSSGGVFSLLADQVINVGGKVYGAIYNQSENRVLHKSSDNVEYEKMRKSKYTQSYIGSVYRDIKDSLLKGANVLFSGTPCQTSGLISYLGDINKDNLIVCDFVCHGVPSMKMLNDNLNLISKKFNQKIIDFDFRPKVKTWAADFFQIKYENNKIRNIPWSEDSYYRGFSHNLILRKSCYGCRYSSEKHLSDITLADFWGYHRYDKDIFDNQGISLIVINSIKGLDFINSIPEDLITKHEINNKFADYIYAKHDEKHYNLEKREHFFRDYVKDGYIKAIKKNNLTVSYKLLIRKKVKKIYYTTKKLLNLK